MPCKLFSHREVCIVEAPPLLRLLCLVTTWLRPCFPRPSGLHNVGLSCYINAAVQALGVSERAHEASQQVCVNAEDAELIRALRDEDHTKEDLELAFKMFGMSLGKRLAFTL